MKTLPTNTFQTNSTTIKTLRYARYRKCPITPDEVRAFFPHLFKRPYRAREAMQRLAQYNYLTKTDTDSWCITDTGIAFLYANAPTYRGEHAN